jgi:ParB family chromosome partitioning protein
LRSGAISAGHARALLAIPAERRDAIAERVVRDGLTVRAVEDLARPATRKSAPAAASRKTISNDHEELLERLRYTFGAHIALVSREHGGALEIRYADDADLLRITDLLLGQTTRA